MKEECIIVRFLKKLGIIKEKEISKEESDLAKRKMCKAAVDSGTCPVSKTALSDYKIYCEYCAWNVD